MVCFSNGLVRFKYATVDVPFNAVRTRFNDGSSCVATAHRTDDYMEITARCGYGTNVFEYCYEHDLMHHFLAEKLADRPSPILWGLAHNAPIAEPLSIEEECAVQMAQTWIRNHVRPIVGGVDWHAFKREFLELTR